eukprot:TRINITY_DN3940_c0_g4_i7.p2 TRINITY_DN3940_c0_g4~~TRINITY_DN3940_c0_g4_i7.p2  ORF type:complete len:106 (+),score=18.70 TRINITY_DN3940_c0_g4_i7:133-450(+)
MPVVCMSTAHACKFPEAIATALAPHFSSPTHLQQALFTYRKSTPSAGPFQHRHLQRLRSIEQAQINDSIVEFKKETRKEWANQLKQLIEKISQARSSHLHIRSRL